jgi:Holliday junction resolvase RusA-like endonuclease
MATRVAITEVVASAREWLKGVAQAALFSVWIDATPTPASRPRVTRWGTYYPKTYQTFLKEAAQSLAKIKAQVTDAPLACIVECVVSKPRTGKLLSPKGDADNYAKGPLDALTKAAKFWNDDSQVHLLIAVKRYAQPGEDAGVAIDYVPLNP